MRYSTTIGAAATSADSRPAATPPSPITAATAMTVDRKPVTTARRPTWDSPAATRTPVAPTSDSRATMLPTPAVATRALAAAGTRGAAGTRAARISAADRTSAAVGPTPAVAGTSGFDSGGCDQGPAPESTGGAARPLR